MTALELRSSINADLDIMSRDMLENISRYVGRLASHVRNHNNATNSIAPRKVKISNRIRQMSGRFDVPADMDKELYSPEEAYEMTMKDIKAIYENKDAV